MPNYDYRCVSCGWEFEMQLTIAERDEPAQVPCPSCDGKLERFLPSPPGFGDPMRLGRTRAPDAFNDVLKNMKKKFRHNNISTR